MAWLKKHFQSLVGVVRPVALGLIFLALVAVLLLWLAGRFSPAAPTDVAASVAHEPLPPGAVLAAARIVRLPLLESAVGTIRAVRETTIASRILARVVQIDLKAGQSVKQNEILVQLDDTDQKARVRQAESEVVSAQAQYDQAVLDEHRMSQLVQTHAVSQSAYDKAATTLRSADASLAGARQALVEMQTVLGYATIRSPMDGIVVDKKVNVGDMVTPGLPLVTIYDPLHMQLIANVRDSLAQRLAVGQKIAVRLDVMDQNCLGQVSEIVPDSQSESRTFQVKVTGPCPPGLYTGMYGRIFIPLEDQEVLVIPSAAVRHVGQLELVEVLDDGVLHRRAVRTGQIMGQDCEVLSGLQAGETVLVGSGSATQPSTQSSLPEAP